MRLSWNEVRARAAAFAADWAEATYERAETQSFYNDFFAVFGIKRRSVARYEERVRLLGDKRGFIDLFWPCTLLVEQKSAGRDLAAARAQAFDYFPGLKPAEHPRFLLLCDFQRFELLDLDAAPDAPERETRFALADLPRFVDRFGFMLGVERRAFREADQATIDAAGLMGRLHDALEASRYPDHDLQRLLVRLVFCLFADGTRVFQVRAEDDPAPFGALVRERTGEDGADLGPRLTELFEVLNTPEGRRQRALDADLARFPYVNGGLFEGRLATPAFDAPMRALLLEALDFTWARVSPAVFGSLFQSVMNPAERRRQGAHYTGERDILKVIEPLFMDELRAELGAAAADRSTGRARRLRALHDRIAALTFLDPACGCGNFLVLAYRELRALELDLLRALHPAGQRVTDVGLLSRLDVDRFFGIELDEFACRIAELALWLTDHAANADLSLAFGEAYARIPLRASPSIRCADALALDWAALLPPERCAYVLGNPPFRGAKMQDEGQRASVRRVAGLPGSGGTLDFVAAWFLKAGDYAREGARRHLAAAAASSPSTSTSPFPSVVMAGLDPATHAAPIGASLGNSGVAGVTVAGAGSLRAVGGRVKPGHDGRGSGEDGGPAAEADAARRAAALRAPRIGFVATNSITQGEQVAQLWPLLFGRCGLEIAFAHRTFAWTSEARGGAHVHVVVIGLAARGAEPAVKRLFGYDAVGAKGEPTESAHAWLSPYLFDASALADRHAVVVERARPIGDAPRIVSGSQPIDDGHFILDAVERGTLLTAEPGAAPYLRPYLGAEEFINGGERWILALQGCPPQALRAMPLVIDRLRAVTAYRRKSQRAQTLAIADTPTRYNVEVIPDAPYLVIPKVSSERRAYVPIGWVEPPTVPSDLLFVVRDATPWHFGVLTSRAHMAWLRDIGGRLESRYRYSIGLAYNPFPWPEADAKEREGVARLAGAVLAARAAHPGAALADLYDAAAMPPDLRRAHAALDRAVDRLYRPAPFASDAERVAHLTALHERLAAPALAAARPAPRRRAARAAAP